MTVATDVLVTTFLVGISQTESIYYSPVRESCNNLIHSVDTLFSPHFPVSRQEVLTH